jgi:5'-3' exoribonuclease 2
LIKQEEGVKVEIKEEPKEATKEEEDDFKEKVSAQVRKSGDKLKDVLFTEDKIRLGEDGWKQRYYQEKFHVKPGPELEKKVSEVVLNYVEGLSWVMKYYYQGCQSWAWYFGYHYAPFASDLKNLHTLDLKFELSEPFKPLDQLMAVLPPASSHCMPRAHRELMVSEYSPIIDFYPENFPVDPNGKRYAWMHIALLPFIDEKRLLHATRSLEESLTEEETRRNSLLTTMMFIHKSHALSWNLMELEANEKSKERSVNMLAEACNNINGIAILPDGELCPKTIKSMYDCMDDIDQNKALCFTYVFPPEQIHVPRVLKETERPPPVLTQSDTPEDPEIWHEKGQRRYDHGGGAGHFMQQQILGNASSRMIYGGPQGGQGPPPGLRPWGGNQARPYGGAGGMNQGTHQRFHTGGGYHHQQHGRPQQYHHQQQQYQRPQQFYQQGGGFQYQQQQGQYQNNQRWSGSRPQQYQQHQNQQYQNNRYSPLNNNNQQGSNQADQRPTRRQRRW